MLCHYGAPVKIRCWHRTARSTSPCPTLALAPPQAPACRAPSDLPTTQPTTQPMLAQPTSSRWPLGFAGRPPSSRAAASGRASSRS
eukprot:1194311-Prorocentrum_minimum.AAC.3